MTTLQINLDTLKVLLKEVVDKPLALDELHEGTTFMEELGLDSITMVALIFLCEERYGLNLDPNKLEGLELRTLGEVIRFLNQQREQERQAA
jgi:acyl carrier protein